MSGGAFVLVRQGADAVLLVLEVVWLFSEVCWTKVLPYLPNGQKISHFYVQLPTEFYM